MTPLLDFNIWRDWYTGMPWYKTKASFCGAVRFLNLGAKALITASVGQKTVSPPSTLFWKVVSAPVEISKSEKALQPCLARMEVRFTSLGPAVGASASAEVRT